MIKKNKSFIALTCVALAAVILLSSCENKGESKDMKKTSKIIVTSEAGDKLAEEKNVNFKKGEAQGTVLVVRPDEVKQTIQGVGSSFTESSAFVLAHLDKDKRQEVMNTIYGKDGAHFSIARTHIGACDFSVEGRYSYADTPSDKDLKDFSIDVDKQGFLIEDFSHLVDENYDLLPMIKEALAVNPDIKIMGSAWTAPSWMKDIEDWYIPGAPENNWQGTGGHLKPEYEQTYADYLVKYLQAYKEEGVNIWALTPVNEPHGNNGQWESMNFHPESQNDFVKHNLGPALVKNGFNDTKLYVYDQNRDGLEDWVSAIYPDKESSKYVDGAAIHWYESTIKVYEDVLDRVHKAYPEYDIIHTEGCIDDLGKDAPNGIGDPQGFKEEGWFDNDDFWWNKNATDWAYTAPWQGVVAEDHPMYTPVHRYARNIIKSLDNWAIAWIDWNIILDKNGGPNHVGNFCGAPIMIDTESKYVYYTPIFHVLSQFSRTIRPGDHAVATERILGKLNEDDLHVSATINDDKLLSVQVLNTTKEAIDYHLQIKDEIAKIRIPANALQTVQVELEEKDIKKEREFKTTPHAAAYGFYRKGQSPAGKCPSKAEMLEDIKIFSKYWKDVRVYGSDTHTEQLLDVIKENDLDIHVMLGIWLENETDHPKKEFANLAQVRKGIELANRFPKIVKSVSVGNETRVFWAYHRMTQENLLKYLRMVRSAVKQPITTADDYKYWKDEESIEVAKELDFISTHIHPIWNSRTLDESMTWLDSVYDALCQMHPQKEIVITETGWPTDYDEHDIGDGAQGTLFVQAPDEVQQEIFFHKIRKWSEEKNVMTYWFEIFDESWKGGGEHVSDDHAEKHWGLYNEDRTQKLTMKNLKDKK